MKAARGRRRVRIRVRARARARLRRRARAGAAASLRPRARVRPRVRCRARARARTRGRLSLWAALSLALLSLSACRGPTCPAQLLTNPAQALARQHTTVESIQSLRAEARIDQRGKQGRIKGRVLMFVERPDHVRFDAMTQFGPALVLTSDGSALALSDFKEDRYYTGESCPSNIARLVGVALSGPEVVRVLLGESPLLAASSESMRCSGEGSYVIERQTASGERQEVELRIDERDFRAAPADQRLTLARATLWDASGKKLYRVRYEDHQRVGKQGARLPFTVRIDDYANDSDAVLRFQSIDVNVSVPPDAFHQEPRAGLTVEQLTCEGASPEVPLAPAAPAAEATGSPSASAP